MELKDSGRPSKQGCFPFARNPFNGIERDAEIQHVLYESWKVVLNPFNGIESNTYSQEVTQR